MINEGTDVIPLNDDDIYVCYAYAINKQRNVIATTFFLRHVDGNHPVVKPGDDNQSACDSIPRHKIILEVLITSKERARSEAFHN